MMYLENLFSKQVNNLYITSLTYFKSVLKFTKYFFWKNNTEHSQFSTYMLFVLKCISNQIYIIHHWHINVSNTYKHILSL